MNKSEELARLLGIEPIFRIKGLDWFNFKTTEHALEFIEKQKNALYERGLIFSEKDIYKVYPDFTKPNNFVKLLDLLNAYLDIRCDRLMAVVPQIIDKSIFLASTNSSRFIDKKNKFKNQAQQTVWEY